MRGPPRRRRRAGNAPVAQSDRQSVVAAIVRRRAGGEGGKEDGGEGVGLVWMPVLEGGVRKRAVRKMRMRICAATKESYTLLSKKR